MPTGLKGWAIWAVAQAGVTFAIRLFIKLVDNAVMGWGDDRLAEFFGFTSPNASTAFNWAIPFVLAAVVLWLFHYYTTRPLREALAKQSGGDGFSATGVVSRASSQTWVRRVEPSHIIILGLVIAAGGVAWLLYQGEAPGQLRKKLMISEQNVRTLEALAGSRASADALMSISRRRLSGLDYDERRRILNTFYKYVNGQIRDTYGLAWNLYNDQPRLINTNQKAVYEELVKIRQQLISEWQDLVAPLVRDGDLYADIRSLNWNFHSTTLLPTLNELINIMRGPVEGGTTIFIDSKETDKLKGGINALGQWIEKTKEDIQTLRSKDDEADIYRSEATP
jgi:hypothetical protein